MRGSDLDCDDVSTLSFTESPFSSPFPFLPLPASPSLPVLVDVEGVEGLGGGVGGSSSIRRVMACSLRIHCDITCAR